MRELFEFIFEKKDDDQIKNDVAKTVFFQDFSRKELTIVLNQTTTRSFKTGERVFFEGDPGQAVYIILSGAVQITKNAKKPIVLATLTKGMFFGELSLVDTAIRSASASIIEDATLLCFFKHDLDHLIKDYPRIGNKLLFRLAHILAQRLRNMNSRMIAEKDRKSK